MYPPSVFILLHKNPFFSIIKKNKSYKEILVRDMKILGIISEYNPFHNGHLFHLQKSMDLTGADAAVVVMSGNFVQRGAPAFADKYLRTQAALESGASIVIELPVQCATATAEIFSQGAVSVLHSLGCIDALCFGSECGDIDQLKQAATLFSDEPPLFQSVLRRELKKGQSFPAARKAAFKACLSSPNTDQLLDSPNNILGIEYLKAIQNTHASMVPYTIKRQESQYHDTALSGKLASASAIRKQFLGAQTFPEAVANALPNGSADLLRSNFSGAFPIWEDDFSLLLKYRLLQETSASLSDYADMNQELSNRIIHNRNRFSSWSQFLSLLKTKELTYTRISRALLHVLLGITKQDLLSLASLHYAPYARVLGFRKDKREVLAEISRRTRIPLILRGSDVSSLPDAASACLRKDLFASNLYASIQSCKSGALIPEEFGRKLLIV